MKVRKISGRAVVRICRAIAAREARETAAAAPPEKRKITQDNASAVLVPARADQEGQ